MYFSIRHKFIFFHIPKTAGITIKNCFSKVIPVNTEYFLWEQKYKDMMKKKFPSVNVEHEIPIHATQPILKIILDENKLYLMKNMYEFTVVRHPYSRIASLSAFSKFNSASDNKFLEIDDVLDLIESNQNSFYCSQFNWIDEKLTNKIHIYKYENLDSDWKKIRIDLNLDLPNLVITNKSENKPLLTQYQKDRCFELLKREFYELDYDRYPK